MICRLLHCPQNEASSVDTKLPCGSISAGYHPGIDCQMAQEHSRCTYTSDLQRIAALTVGVYPAGAAAAAAAATPPQLPCNSCSSTDAVPSVEGGKVEEAAEPKKADVEAKEPAKEPAKESEAAPAAKSAEQKETKEEEEAVSKE